jgi:ADP-ribosylglycohydrolase
MSQSPHSIRRRSFLGASAAAPAAFAAPPAAVPLREKFFGCIAACHIGSSMGAVVEGWTWDRIEKEYGTFDRLASYEHYRNGWKREPGTTEDGVERQKLMITAIIEKRDRVNAEDVRKIWVRDIKPESAGMVSEPFEATLLAMAKAGIPARDIGKYCDYAGLNSFARSCHPIGLINAGDPAGAVADVYEVGQLYQTSNSRGLQWASVTALAIAAATRPGATMDSVLAAILDEHPKLTGAPAVAREIERGLKHTAAARDFRAMRTAFDAIYSGAGTPYAFSSANEVVTKAVCVFRMSAGNPRDAIVNSVNMGRPQRRRGHSRRMGETGRLRHHAQPLHQLAAHSPPAFRRPLRGLPRPPRPHAGIRAIDGSGLNGFTPPCYDV